LPEIANERKKMPKANTPAAIAAASALARSRLFAPVYSVPGIESLATFSKLARQRWESIPVDIRMQLLSNVWCGQCSDDVTITEFSGAIRGNDLLLVGQCAECHGNVARVIEAE
jgi:hypothetical protein